MQVEILVAVIGGIALIGSGVVSAVAATIVARRQARVLAVQTSEDYKALRDKLLWEEADKFWTKRAADLSNQVNLERRAREAETTSLRADIAINKQDLLRLTIDKGKCEDSLRSMEDRLSRINDQLSNAGKVITGEA